MVQVSVIPVTQVLSNIHLEGKNRSVVTCGTEVAGLFRVVPLLMTQGDGTGGMIAC